MKLENQIYSELIVVILPILVVVVVGIVGQMNLETVVEILFVVPYLII
ncbi:Uncharacterised protein [Chlamydia trachomatis]|nr:Uncharacterised protein [Chlamydia trachomatis]